MADDEDDIAEDRVAAQLAMAEKVRKTYSPKPHPDDDYWHSAIALDQDKDTGELLDAVRYMPITAYARIILADMIERYLTKRPGRPKRPIYLQFDSQMEWAREFVKVRRARLKKAERAARREGRLRDAQKFAEQLSNLLSVTASEFKVSETTLANFLDGSHEKKNRRSRAKPRT